jgi:hypothetical protein
MVSGAGRLSSPRALAAAAFLASLALTLASCDFLKTTPFPGFVAGADASVDLAGRIDGIAGGESQITYDLQIVEAAGKDPRLLLLVEPPSSDDASGFDYKGKLIFLDEDLGLLGQAGVATSLDYFSKPYSYTHDGDDILAGYTVLTQDGGPTGPPPKLGTAHGLEGYAFTDGISTFLFSTPSGAYSSFDLAYRSYINGGWNIDDDATMPIIPASSRPSPSEPNYPNLGYQLIGLRYNSTTDEVTFVLSEPAQRRILAARASLASATDGATPLLGYSGGWPVPASAWPVSIEADRPLVAVSERGLFLARRDGWMEFHRWTETGALALVGEPQRIVGDRALNRPYAFLDREASGGPSYMYRFDPASRMLTRYEGWWR